MAAQSNAQLLLEEEDDDYLHFVRDGEEKGVTSSAQRAATHAAIAGIGSVERTEGAAGFDTAQSLGLAEEEDYNYEDASLVGDADSFAADGTDAANLAVEQDAGLVLKSQSIETANGETQGDAGSSLGNAAADTLHQELGAGGNANTAAIDTLRDPQQQQQQQPHQLQQHRHHLPDRPTDHHRALSGLIGFIVILLVVAHALALLVWLRAWWRQRRSKSATMRAPTPPQKVSATYDMDKPTFAMPKIELAQLTKTLKPSQA